jgi:hypothetical protein
MQLIFGLELDDLALPRPATESGVHYCGRKILLHLLESYLGLEGYPDDIQYLRVEQYRQGILHQVASSVPQLQQENGEEKPVLFYLRSFEADQFATASELLVRRDELLLAGWDFAIHQNTPPRLATLASLEAFFIADKQGEKNDPENMQTSITLSPGYADRFVEIIKALDTRPHPFTEILLNEPFQLLPCHFQRLIKKLSNTSARPAIRQITFTSIHPQESSKQSQDPGKEHKMSMSDLQAFQQRLLLAQTGQNSSLESGKHLPGNDGSLLLIRSKRASEAADWLARLFRINHWAANIGPQAPSPLHKPSGNTPYPALLINEKNRILEMALIEEGMPSLGIHSASLARPTLQILKLVPAFLWEPINPFKILEFVSLSIKPLADELANLIANHVANAPGLQGEGWYAMINRYFEELEESQPEAAVHEQRRQYSFWFERPRHDMNRTVPKGEVIRIFDYLREWAYNYFEENNSKNNSLLVLSSQSRRIVELLQALPETELTHLELERIVRTIYEPSPVVFQEREAGHFPFVMHPGAFMGEMDEIWWWNFIQNDPPHFFSKWYQNERNYLAAFHIHPDTPEQENALQRWQQVRPALLAKKRLVLVLPETVEGEEVLPHPLFGDLQAAFSKLEALTHQVGTGQWPAGSEQSAFAKHFILPKYEKIAVRQLGRPKPFLNVRNLDKLLREKETLTSLEALFYFPYQWFFRYKIRLNQSSILSVVKDNTLMGNLAHRIFEKLLREDIYSLDKPALDRWVERETRRLLSREGAVLLMYGREPERVHFVNQLKYSTWSLICYIRENGWQVKATEMELEGNFPAGTLADSSIPALHHAQVQVKGIADLVLERGDELAVVDLKWRGRTHRENMLRNEEDLQLVLYARLVSPEGQWAHTSFFIIENAKMLARNNQAFNNITPLAPTESHREVNERILQKMEATWHWRMQQLANGRIEIRCRQTLPDIEDVYSGAEQGELMMKILEMKNEDARYDDYRTLINLVE